jgi:hypothetical protein
MLAANPRAVLCSTKPICMSDYYVDPRGRMETAVCVSTLYKEAMFPQDGGDDPPAA